SRVSEVDGGLESGNQPFVAVGGRICQARERRRVFQDSTNEKQGDITEPGVAVPGEKRFVAVPKRNVSVHAAAVVAEDWLWHEGHRSVVPLGDVAQDVFVVLHVVAHAFERRVTNV